MHKNNVNLPKDHTCAMTPLLFRLFRANETKVHELNYLFWECTTRCNLACRHCGSDCSVLGREQDMPLADWRHLTPR